MKKRAPLAALAVSLVAVAVACEIAFPTHEAGIDALRDASIDGVVSEGGPPTVDAGCVLAVPPPPPSSDTDTGQMLPLLALAVRSINFGDAGASTPLGFDLDGVCTCPGPPSCKASVANCDDLGGRDHAGNVLFSLIDQYFQESTNTTLNQNIADGRVTVILQVQEYNGGADDTQILLSGVVSNGMIVDPDAGTSNITYRVPNWDGHDVWNIDSTSVKANPVFVAGNWVYTPLAYSNQAYVTGGVMVARIPSILLGVSIGSVEITDVTISGHLSASSEGFRFDGQLAGRVSTRDLMVLSSGLHDPSSPQDFVCGDSGTAQAFRSIVCENVDIAASPALDDVDASCTSISVAFAFTAVSAVLGAPFTGKLRAVGCDGSVVDCTP